MHNHVIFLFQQFIIFIIEKYSNWKRANLRRIFVPFRETSHIVIVAVWARTNFREIRCFTFYAQLPQCHRRLQPCLRHQNLGASINDTAATYNKKRQGCETWPWLYCWKWEGGDWEESLGKPKLSASTARHLMSASSNISTYWSHLPSASANIVTDCKNYFFDIFIAHE